jgi:hypothetical protein
MTSRCSLHLLGALDGSFIATVSIFPRRMLAVWHWPWFWSSLDLGNVVGLPTWVNRPPSESQIAATIASGRKPKIAGSLYFLLESKAKVDLALSRGRILLCSLSPVVSRGFPHLRVTQCWKCYKYGPTKARCNVKQPCCPTCAQPACASHSSPCNGPIACVNC